MAVFYFLKLNKQMKDKDFRAEYLKRDFLSYLFHFIKKSYITFLLQFKLILFEVANFYTESITLLQTLDGHTTKCTQDILKF